MAFLAAALTVVALIFSLSAVIALAQERVVESLRAGTVTVKRWGGRILIAVGVWLVVLAIWADTFARIFPV